MDVKQSLNDHFSHGLVIGMFRHISYRQMAADNGIFPEAILSVTPVTTLDRGNQQGSANQIAEMYKVIVGTDPQSIEMLVRHGKFKR